MKNKEKKQFLGKLKNSKINVLISLSIIIILVILSIVIYTIYFKKETPQKGEYAIVNETIIKGYKFVDIFKNLYFVIKNNKLGVIDQNGKTQLDFIYDDEANVTVNNDTVVIKQENTSYLYDEKLNLITTSEEEMLVIEDSITKKTYYYLNNNLYNLEKNILLNNISKPTIIINNYVWCENELINLTDKQRFSIQSLKVTANNIFAISENNQELYIYDKSQNNLTSYAIIKEDDENFYLKDENSKEHIFIKNIGEFKDTSKIEIGNYKLSFDTCETGFKIYDSNDNLISNDCFDNYTNVNNEITLFKDTKTYGLYNDNIIELHQNQYLIGKYILEVVDGKNTINLYDIKGKIVNNNICYANLEYVNNDLYVCHDGSNTFLIDQDFNKRSSNYDDIYCLPETKYCITTLNNKSGLLWNQKVLVEPSYYEILYEKDEKKIIANNVWGFKVFSLDIFDGTNLVPKENFINDVPQPYNAIDVNNIIEKYQLDWMKDVIFANEDLFKKYAYIVENNNGLDNYQEKVMHLFYELALNKKYLDEDYFLSSLMQLHFEKKNSYSELGSLAIYDTRYKRIETITNENNVIYHELNHFLDSSINREYNDAAVFKCNNEYISHKDYNKLNAKEKDKCVNVISEASDFLVEAGAEYYSGSYLNDNILRVYHTQTLILAALSYIYGYDYLNDIFFSGSIGDYKLFMLFNKAGISVERYNELLKLANTKYHLDNAEYFKITDTLIDVYESQNKTSWYEDKEFSEIIAMIIGFNKRDSSYTNRYEEYEKLDYNFEEKYSKLIDLENMYLSNIPCEYLYTNDGSYLIFNFLDDNYENIYEVIKYDFKNDQVISRKTISDF